MILMYHKVDKEAKTMWWVEISNFYRQMHELRDKQVVHLDDYEIGNKDQVVITFDGLYKNVLKYAVPILEKFGYPFEVFITSEYLGKDNSFDTVEPYAEFVNLEDLKEVVKKNGRIQWHTKTHKNLGNIEDEQIIEDELTIPSELKAIDEKSFKWFAYPHGQFNSKVLKVTEKYFDGAVSCNQGNDNDRYILNRMTVENDTKLSEHKISVIVPCYNYGMFLEEAVESLLKQTIIPDEILIVDDYSTDNTSDIGRYYAEKYPELIRFYRNEKNLGIINNFNKAIGNTSGDLICFLGADNIFRNDYIEKTSQILLENPKVGIAYTDFVLFGDRAKVVYDEYLDERKGEIIDNKYYRINFPEFNVEELAKGNYIHGSSMYRRCAFDDVGGYRTQGTEPEDYNLFHRIVAKGWLAKRVPEAVLEYRQHSTDQANVKNIMIAQLAFYKKDNNELRAVLNHRDKDIEELKGALEKKEKDIQELEEAITYRLSDIRELREALDCYTKNIEELKNVLNRRGNDIEELKNALNHRENDIEELKGALDCRENDIKELKQVVNCKENDIEELKGALICRENDVEELKEALISRDKDIEELKEALENRN